MLSYIYTKVRILIFERSEEMTTLTLNINDLEKLAKNGNDDLVILTKMNIMN